MSIKTLTIAPLVAAAGISVGLLAAPTAAASIDPCDNAVSTSRCDGGIDGGAVSPSPGALNGPYGPWGNVPPLG